MELPMFSAYMDGKILHFQTLDEVEKHLGEFGSVIRAEIEKQEKRKAEGYIEPETVYEKFNLRINKKEAIEAYIQEFVKYKEHIGHYMIMVDYGLFAFKNTDTIQVKPQWVPNGTFEVAPDAVMKVHEFLVCNMFDWEQIEKFTTINYKKLRPEEREKAMNFDKDIIGSLTLDKIQTRPVIDDVPHTIIYNLIWE